MPIPISGSFRMFETGSSPDDNIRGAVRSTGIQILDTDSFRDIITASSAPGLSGFFRPDRFNNGLITSSEQFRGYPNYDCPTGIHVEEITLPGSVRILLKAIFLGPHSSGSISSGSGGGLSKGADFVFEVLENSTVSSTADPGTNSTFEGWGSAPYPTSVFTSSLTLNFEATRNDDFYAFFNRNTLLSSTFCSHSILAPAFDVCYSCNSSSISYGPVTVYHSASLADTEWFLDEGLTTTVADGRYYPQGGDASGVFYQVENGYVTQVITCPNGNTLTC